MEQFNEPNSRRIKHCFRREKFSHQFHQYIETFYFSIALFIFQCLNSDIQNLIKDRKRMNLTEKEENPQDVNKFVNEAPSFEPKTVPKTRRVRNEWMVRENRKYLKFIQQEIHRDKLKAQFKIQKQKIYNQMANFIGSRTSRQCKSHHQKLIDKYGSIDQIILEFEKQLKRKQIKQNMQFQRAARRAARAKVELKA